MAVPLRREGKGRAIKEKITFFQTFFERNCKNLIFFVYKYQNPDSSLKKKGLY